MANLRDLLQQTIREQGLRALLLMVGDAAIDEANGIRDEGVKDDNNTGDDNENVINLREIGTEVKELTSRAYA